MKSIFAGAIGAVAFAGTFSFAAEKTSIETMLAQCARLEHLLDRITCYDGVSGRSPKVEKSEGIGTWKVNTQTSALDDSKSVFITVESDEIINCGWNKGARISLVVRCLENTTSIYLNTGCHMVSNDYDGYGVVEYRIEDDPARKKKMDVDTTNTAIGLWSGRQSIPLIKQLLGRDRLLVRATPYGNRAFTATFAIAGLDELIGPLRQSCNW